MRRNDFDIEPHVKAGQIMSGDLRVQGCVGMDQREVGNLLVQVNAALNMKPSHGAFLGRRRLDPQPSGCVLVAVDKSLKR